MRPEERDAAYLWDMRDAARQIHEIAGGLQVQDYLGDRLRQLAVERCLEILGEAARRISDRVRLEHPEIPWHQIIAQRNMLAHEYGDIRHEMIWRVVSERIPELLTILERLVPPPPPPEG